MLWILLLKKYYNSGKSKSSKDVNWILDLLLCLIRLLLNLVSFFREKHSMFFLETKLSLVKIKDLAILRESRLSFLASLILAFLRCEVCKGLISATLKSCMNKKLIRFSP